jgi:hypothetical protein
MILGVDHLILSTNDLDKSVQEFESKGYVSRFTERNLLNHPSKSIFLSVKTPVHDIAFLENAGTFAVEAVQHGTTLDSSKGPFWFDGKKLIVESTSLFKEIPFWIHALNFKKINENHLELIGPVAHWNCKVEFIENPNQSSYLLNGSGFTCLAFVSSNIEGDLEMAKKAGASDVLPPFDITVNEKALRVSLFRSPTNIICEFIQIMRK